MKLPKENKIIRKSLYVFQSQGYAGYYSLFFLVEEKESYVIYACMFSPKQGENLFSTSYTKTFKDKKLYGKSIPAHHLDITDKSLKEIDEMITLMEVKRRLSYGTENL